MTKKARRVLDLDGYLPAYLSQITNKWSRGASRIYLANFGIGINEWRVMTLFAIEPGTTAQRCCAILGIDKAAANRSVAHLEDLKLLGLTPNPNDGRSFLIHLTEKGWRIHDAILEIALTREALLFKGLSSAERRTLLSLLDRVRSNLSLLDTDTPK
jgi:DNA-binding MarR family transcriptional regulator